MVVAEDLVRVILTDKWLPAAPVIVLLCAFSMIRALEMMLAPALMAAYRPRFVFRYQLTLMVVLVPAFWFGALYGGAPGVALAWVTAYPVVAVWMAREALTELHASFHSLWLELRAPVAVTVVMMVAVIAVRHLLSWMAADLAWERLAVLVLTGVAVYGVGLLAVGGPVRGELLELAGWLFRRVRSAGAAVSDT
jgi:O-antigen/teichoic acid export membrane protein